jgi:CheY-like chemotaxis protein
LDAGCDDYIRKPVDRAALFQTLQRYMPAEPHTAPQA